MCLLLCDDNTCQRKPSRRNSSGNFSTQWGFCPSPTGQSCFRSIRAEVQCSGSKQEVSAFPFAFHVGHKHLRQRGGSGGAVGGLVRQISLPGGNSHTSQADSKFSCSSVSETKSCLEFNTFGSCPRPSVVEAHLALAAQLEHSVKCRKKDYTELFAQDIHNLGPLEGNTDSFIPRNLVANVWLIKCHQLVPSEGNWVRFCALQCFPVCLEYQMDSKCHKRSGVFIFTASEFM